VAIGPLVGGAITQTLGWGIGLVAHWWTVYAQSEDRHAAAVEAEMRKLRERDG
jgi:hypothetical protein